MSQKAIWKCSCGDFCGEDPACELHRERKLTAEEYEYALARIDMVMDAIPGTTKFTELDALVTLVEVYEKDNFPIGEPTTEEAALFRREQEDPSIH